LGFPTLDKVKTSNSRDARWIERLPWAEIGVSKSQRYPNEEA
jgi:hypothetical protein